MLAPDYQIVRKVYRISTEDNTALGKSLSKSNVINTEHHDCKTLFVNLCKFKREEDCKIFPSTLIIE